MATLTPSSIILSNLNENSGSIPDPSDPTQQPANDFTVQFRQPIYLKEDSRIALKSIQFEPSYEIVIDETCDTLYMYLNGGGGGTIGAPYPSAPANAITITQDTYTIETLLENISNAIMNWGDTYNPPDFNDHFGIRVFLNDKGFVRFQIERIDNSQATPPTHYNAPLEIQLWTFQPRLANILGLALSPDGQESQVHTLTNTSGYIQFIDADYQPYVSMRATSLTNCCLVELQNLRIKALNSYVRGSVNVIAKCPIYNFPFQSYVQYEPATEIYYKTSQCILTEIRIRLLNLDMTKLPVTGQKPTVVILEVLPPE